MFWIVTLTCVSLAFGQINLPHGHELKDLVDKGFARLDHNPTDGVVSQAEFDMLVHLDDANNDSCVDHHEYTTAHHPVSAEVADKMFYHFDHNNDNCLTVDDMKAEYPLTDHNHDGTVTLHEFEQYFTHLLQQLFGGNGNGR